jgi:hypothetical protein
MPDKIMTKRFRLPITVERRAEIGHDLASTLNRIDLVESQKKQAADGYKAELELLDQKARRLRVDIDEAKADFDIEVFIEQDFNANAILYRRLLRDTVNSEALPDDQQKGEVLEERAMTAEEREAAAQMPLGEVRDVTEKYTSEDEAAEVRTCTKCGCTEENACAGGCAWVGEPGSRFAELCTACLPRLSKKDRKMAEAAMAGQGEAGGARA